ncbi:diadenylate cyclase [Lacinutrix jangbogonensis]|uniref:diadenylate cyclase n=1 Tax=Lacinutrix jangbogonensis TaxID=1469557 RepID=UPI00053F1E35|nr:diadenylate cyclase [Lacinutrix jangbogonensis]
MEIFDNILNFGIKDYIDVFLVALLLFYIYRLVRGTVAINIFLGIVVIYFIYLIVEALQMVLLTKILGGFISVGFIALIVVFQQEVRKFLLMIGSTNFASKRGFLKHIKFLKMDGVSALSTDVDVIIAACNKMSTTKTGALIVLERNNNLDFLVTTGDEMNIKVTQPIIESIFFKNSPLHDGAIIIENNIVKATRVILPVNNEKTIPQRFGLRHRAAVGITEKTDAIAITVSEETGQISCFRNGTFVAFKDPTELIEIIKEDLI